MLFGTRLGNSLRQQHNKALGQKMLRIVEMQVTMYYQNQVGFAICAKFNSVLVITISLTRWFTCTLLVPCSISCTCQCTQIFCLFCTYLAASPTQKFEIYERKYK